MTSAGSGGRRGEAARTCPCPSRRPRPLGRAHRRPRPPSERRVRREHDFCLQAGFPPGHDGRGPPTSSRPNVSEDPGGGGGSVATRALSTRPSAGWPLPRRARRARRLLCPGNAGGGSGSAASRGLSSRRWARVEEECPGLLSGAGTGERGAGTGVRNQVGDRRARPAGRERGPSEDRAAGRGVRGSGFGDG